MAANTVDVFTTHTYDECQIYEIIKSSECFNKSISRGETIVIKPNWVKESHLYRLEDWDYVITHPAVISATLKAVLELLNGAGKVVITDGPQTDSSFSKIMEIMNPQQWIEMGKAYGIPVEIVDLRDDEWVNRGDVTVSRTKLPGDPQGSTEVNLIEENSEFFGHKRSNRGYYGADYDLNETNRAHDGHNNLYRVSRSIIGADVFINLPKMKTHKKAGLTCCLKNLVGINTYKNYLPHHSEGSCCEGGDQFPAASLKNSFEGRLMAFLKQNLLQNQLFAKLFVPLKHLGKSFFGSTENVVRSGNWYGNDTIWRTILDLNKVLLYANPDGTMRPDTIESKKKYIGIVDGIYAGEGNGPMAPDKVEAGKLVIGTNPVAIDAVCACLMNFDYRSVPSIVNAFKVNRFKICDFQPSEIVIRTEDGRYPLDLLPDSLIMHFRPHFGWKGHLERKSASE